jgi:methionyl aminopeptidase
MEPQVFHYRNNDGIARITPGMIFTVEPMINLGGWRHTLLNDGWTAMTADGRRSAQFEQTILVTENGVEVLTSSGRSQADRG